MRREQILARLCRALSGKTQGELAEEAGVDRSLIAQFELGDVVPGRDHLERLAGGAGLTLEEAEAILRLYETLRTARRQRPRSPADLFDRLAQDVRSQAEWTYRRVAALPLPEPPPQAADRDQAEELFSRLVELPEGVRAAVVRVAEEFQSWALCEKVSAVSVEEASRGVELAAAWARLGQEIAGRVPGPETWRDRLRGYAAAHSANALRVAGDLKASEATFEEARRLWQAGSDPYGVLDPGRLLDLEASLRRDQRRLGEALALLAEAAAVGHQPERALINKGFTLEVMGEPERAVETFLQARPLVESGGDPRLLYMLYFNLAVSYCHLGRYAAAAELLEQVREVAVQRGDENEVIRLTWLQGRIAAGLGRFQEARSLLAQARRAFELRGKSYDVALALLEEAVLLLDEGRTAEVKGLAGELTRIFEDKGVHREALAALSLFYEAAEREEVTPDLARRLLRFLSRCRYDQSLRFGK